LFVYKKKRKPNLVNISKRKILFLS